MRERSAHHLSLGTLYPVQKPSADSLFREGFHGNALCAAGKVTIKFQRQNVSIFFVFLNREKIINVDATI